MTTIFREYRRSDAERSDRSAGDRLRHRQKVRESIREHIADIISEESIIGKDKDRVIKVPLRGIKEFRFIFGDNAPGAAEGDGDTQPGQVVGKKGEGPGKGDEKAGDRPGVDYYETDVTLEELIEIMFEDLELPHMERKALREVVTDADRKLKGQRKKGIRARLKPRATVKEKIKRTLKAKLNKEPEEITEEEFLTIPEHLQRYYRKERRDDGTAYYKLRLPFHTDDLRYRNLEIKPHKESNAVVLCVMDCSGSMDTLKKYLARSFFFLLYQFITTRYQNVEIVFIAFHTEAREVTEEEFFHKGESGGTFISSGHQKALDIIHERYHPSLWNIYVFNASDGDNFDSDNPTAVRTAEELIKVCNRVGYAEIKPLGSRYYESSMLNVFRRVGEEEKFVTVLIERKEDVWPAFKRMMSIPEKA